MKFYVRFNFGGGGLDKFGKLTILVRKFTWVGIESVGKKIALCVVITCLLKAFTNTVCDCQIQ